MKKIIRFIKIAWYSLFYGMKSADKLLSTNNKSDELDANDIGGLEQQQEQQSVYKDLLKGEVTEAVRELRHEMYYSERKSHEYVYSGGGHAKKNTMFDYNGHVDKSDGFKIILVQNNGQITTSFSEAGLSVYGQDYSVEGNINNVVRNRVKSEKEFRIKIERSFIPRFKLENYVTKVVVKEVEEDKVLLDLYVSKYVNKLEKTSKLFHSEMENIYQGFTKTDTIDFDNLHFITKNAYGSSDLIEHKYKDIVFDNIIEFDGSYVLKFFATIDKKDDLITEFYHEATAEKCDNHELREGATIDFLDAVAIQEKENYDVNTANNLINKTKK